MKKRLTKRAALAACADMWNWIAGQLELNPRASVVSLKYRYEQEHSVSYYSECPCCEYALGKDGVNCSRCPLKSLWPTQGADGSIYGDCMHNDAAYCIAKYDPNPAARVAAARLIADTATRLLNHMPPLKSASVAHTDEPD